MAKDKEIVSQLNKFLSVEGEYSVDHLNGVGIVLESPSARLTPTRKYIFDLILGIFGENISSKIFLMITFADGQEPPALAAANEAQIPYEIYFKFNNSSVFVAPSMDIFARIYWDIGVKSFDQFFMYVEKSSPVSIELTREVLKERERLESIVQKLEDKLPAFLDKRNKIDRKKAIHKHEMQVCAELKSKIEKQAENKIKTLNCLKCTQTCHCPCEAENDKQFNCTVMSNRGSKLATCSSCPSQCAWDVHVVQGFPHQSTTDKEQIELQLRYKLASDRCKEVKSSIDQLEDDLSLMQENVKKMSNLSTCV